MTDGWILMKQIRSDWIIDFWWVSEYRAKGLVCLGWKWLYSIYCDQSHTVNRSCQCGAIQSPAHCYNIWEMHGEAVWSLIWPLHASGGSAIPSQSPYKASDHIFRSSINSLLPAALCVTQQSVTSGPLCDSPQGASARFEKHQGNIAFIFTVFGVRLQ